MEEHDDASLMIGEEEHHHHHPAQHHSHHHEDVNGHDDHEIHDDDEEHMDIEPTRIEGVSTTTTTTTAATPAPLVREDFWDHEPTKEEIWEVRPFQVLDHSLEKSSIFESSPRSSIFFPSLFSHAHTRSLVRKIVCQNGIPVEIINFLIISQQRDSAFSFGCLFVSITSDVRSPIRSSRL